MLVIKFGSAQAVRCTCPGIYLDYGSHQSWQSLPTGLYSIHAVQLAHPCTGVVSSHNASACAVESAVFSSRSKQLSFFLLPQVAECATGGLQQDLLTRFVPRRVDLTQRL